MMRKTPASSMQKTYDDCYLTCSTAIYFEGQNNEAEALRAWRNALDAIYYHNAYKIPSGYSPRSETEKALQDSLRAMELQCKERVDLLEALKKSRDEALEEAKSQSKESLQNSPRPSVTDSFFGLGDGTVRQASYADIPRPAPALPARPVAPPRPSYQSRKSSHDNVVRAKSLGDNIGAMLAPPGMSVEQPTRNARTPSPEKKGTMLRTLRSNPRDSSSSGRMVNKLRYKPPTAATNAASKVWVTPQKPSGGNAEQTNGSSSSSSNVQSTSWDPYSRTLKDSRPSKQQQPEQTRRASDNTLIRPPSPSDYLKPRRDTAADANSPIMRHPPPYPDYPILNPYANAPFANSEESFETAKPPPTPPHREAPRPIEANTPQPRARSPPTLAKAKPATLAYMKEYPDHPPSKQKRPPTIPSKSAMTVSDSERASNLASPRTVQAKSSPTVPRKAVNTRAVGVASATQQRQQLDNVQASLEKRVTHDPQAEKVLMPAESGGPATRKPVRRKMAAKQPADGSMTPPATDESQESGAETLDPDTRAEWENRTKRLLKNLPKGVDEASAKQILNEIVIQGDEVHWDDVAGLEIAKSALKETVVYPFLRPDLFMGLREPARGMLLFGPPGTGKTMLARAVATESKSVFFAISASSLTSKFLGESEKLVRALFACAKALAPSIIFVDEIDSLLGSRGGSSEHEATRRIKTEFLIQWSDLQKAAAGRDNGEGDATRVLVLAATNLPWAIDEAARRRFVRRQYIPLPEDHVRGSQLKTLMSAQKHSLGERENRQLVRLTDGYSGSDITALAKDAAMGPLRSLGEQLLHMSPEDIRPISMQDFQASLINIRPSVSKQGLKEFEDWARDFGERGG